MTSLGVRLAGAPDRPLLRHAGGSLTVAALAPPPAAAAGAVVALCYTDPASFIADLIVLDGVAAGLLLLAPGLPAETVTALMASAGATLLRSDRADLADIALAPGAGTAPAAATETAWLMTTSGTTGLPKIVNHSLASLSRSVRPLPAGMAAPRWGLLYEPSRFAGLQVVLQALLGGGTLIAPDLDAGLPAALRVLAAEGCTHLSATPSLWRKLLMTPGAGDLPLAQVTLGGEIADHSVLVALAARYPASRIVHIYASTEVGVGFSVRDGLPGFPAAWLDEGVGGAQLRINDGQLWIRPPGGRAAAGSAGHINADADGFLSTGDRVRHDGDRVLFLGRDSSTVNIGGTKIHPEDIEAIVNRHPDVVASKVTAKPNPILGALLQLAVAPRDPGADPAALRAAVKAWCREQLPRMAQPATITIVDSIETTAAGKISRQ